MPRGYDRPLYIQPFDHRASFETGMFGWKSPLTEAQTAEIAAAKRVIFDGFKAAVAAGVPKAKSVSWWTSSSALPSCAMRRRKASHRLRGGEERAGGV